MTPNPNQNSEWTIWKFSWGILLLIFLSSYLFFLLITYQLIQPAWMFAQLLFDIFMFLFLEAFVMRVNYQDRIIRLHHLKYWRIKTRQIQFDELHTIAVMRGSMEDSGLLRYWLFLALNNGEGFRVPLVYGANQKKMHRLAEKLAEMINSTRATPVRQVKDGWVSVELTKAAGIFDGELVFIYCNDQNRVTHWVDPQNTSSGGFILIIPAHSQNSREMPNGFMGAVAAQIYNRTLFTLGLKDVDFPEFEKAVTIPGKEIGLADEFTLVCNDPLAAKKWITPQRVRVLDDWVRSNPLQGNRGAVLPYLLVTTNGLRVILRNAYYQEAQREVIAKFGAMLSREG